MRKSREEIIKIEALKRHAILARKNMADGFGYCCMCENYLPQDCFRKSARNKSNRGLAGYCKPCDLLLQASLRLAKGHKPKTYLDQGVMNTEPRNISYLAALIDGEGMISVRRLKNCSHYQPIVSISNTCLSMLLEIRNLFGGSFGKGKRSSKVKTCYRLYFYGKRMVDILEAVRPHLKIKSRQADLVIKMSRHMDEHRFGRHYRSETEKAKRDLMSEELRNLNARNGLDTEVIQAFALTDYSAGKRWSGKMTLVEPSKLSARIPSIALTDYSAKGAS